jgi:hypothetical protein
MADELDDRLRDLARDAEPLVVLAGPQAARTRGELRRARRRTGAAAVAAALALAVGGWQLLPRLDGGGDGGVPSAATATAGRTPSQLEQRLGTRLLPASALPYAATWRWTVMTPEQAAKAAPSCPSLAADGASAVVTRGYAAPAVSAVAHYYLAAYGDADTAGSKAAELRKILLPRCGLVATVPGSGGSMAVEGASKDRTGVTVWVQSLGPYVAALFVTAPGDPRSRFQDTGIEKCLAASLHGLDPGAVRTTPPGAADKGAAGGEHSAGDAAKDGVTAFGTSQSTATC